MATSKAEDEMKEREKERQVTARREADTAKATAGTCILWVSVSMSMSVSVCVCAYVCVCVCVINKRVFECVVCVRASLYELYGSVKLICVVFRSSAPTPATNELDSCAQEAG